MVNHMRHTRSHTANRRSHHALAEPRMAKCTNCSAMHVRHTLCTTCGTYRGKQIVDLASVSARRLERKRVKQETIRQESGTPAQAQEKEEEKAA